MQSVGDQIALLATSLERDHVAALHRIDELTTNNDSLTSANAMLEKQLADRSDALAAADKQLADALAMVEQVAAAALNMLKVTRGAAPIEAVRPAPKVPAVVAPSIIPVLLTDEMLKPTTPTFAQQVAADIMAGDNVKHDSGDETDGDAILIGDSDDGHEMVDLSPIKEAIEQNLAAAPAPVSEPVAAPIVEDSAVDRMRRSADLLPSPTLMAPAPTRPTLVVHNDGGLPIFLQRDTVFQRGDTGQVFM